jgi:hypothetical protein
VGSISKKTKAVSGCDKYGKYQIEFDANVLSVKATGIVGVVLAKSFHRDICNLAKGIDSNSWGYYGELSNCEAYTDPALEILLSAHEYCIMQGCVVDAYCIVSPLAIEQIRKVREKAGVFGSICSNIFNHEDDALRYIVDAITSHQNLSVN